VVVVLGARVVVGAIVVAATVVVGTGVVVGLVEPLPQAASSPPATPRARNPAPGRRRIETRRPDLCVPTVNVYCVGGQRATVAG